MKITWYGHAAFGIETRTESGEDRRVIFDPYNYPDCGGYLPIDEPADVVSISHENRKYHSDTSSIRGEFERLDGLELAAGERSAQVAGLDFAAHEVFENDRGEGPNAMVKLLAEGLVIAHQGDLGHALEGEALDFLRDVDVLLALAGGAPTLALDDLARLVEATRPAIVLPMHYRTPKVNLDILPLEDVLRALEGHRIERPGRTTLAVTLDGLPGETRVVVLDHAR